MPWSYNLVSRGCALLCATVTGQYTTELYNLNEKISSVISFRSHTNRLFSSNSRRHQKKEFNFPYKTLIFSQNKFQFIRAAGSVFPFEDARKLYAHIVVWFLKKLFDSCCRYDKISKPHKYWNKLARLHMFCAPIIVWDKI